ncbi:hypothetical protein ABZX30_28480 [Streptomyces sp. NPDC004542]|uniref:hypothetical protein n=1 Tax=Streptomyces sp. NPDC004542 TaxID=3154281 RepID=UPI0033AEC6A7
MRVLGGLRSFSAVVALCAALAVFPAWSPTPAAGADLGPGARVQPVRSPDSGPALRHDTSPPLRTLARAAGQVPVAPRTPAPPGRPSGPALPGRAVPDPVVQRSQGGPARIPLRRSFEGVSHGGTVPPDPNASVGSSQIMEVTNLELAVFSKTGDSLLGQIPVNTLWKGFGGPCETGFNVDPVVRWDTLARRWVFTLYSVDNQRLCVGVSTTPDATGSYHRYVFGYQEDPDYEKVSVWPGAYYVTINSGGPGRQEACAWDRGRMLRGEDAGQQCYLLPADHFLLASDLDGTRPPRRGEPNLLVTLGDTDDTLRYYRFHADWTNQSLTSVTGPGNLRVAPFTRACERTNVFGDSCVPQAGTRQKLDSLSYFPMYRLAYRNFGDHEALVFNHSVDARGAVGVRWYELRLRNGRPVVHQQSTYAPDTTYRWMGSVAQDRAGDIALGYSQSSAQDHPSIRVTGRLADDPPSRMTFHETTVWTGAGSQTGSHRWGDYTSMAIDPSDDCTFWYTNQYQPADGVDNWHTRIASFRLPGCDRRRL